MDINNIKISIALTTYNGEKYIEKQLKSIFDQTRKPDEVIICDDGSKDSTVSLINDFISSHNINNWKVYINTPNVGWQRNFFKAAGMTTGDIIFFSDQDDIWLKDKIENMSRIMCEYNMNCLYAEKNIIDANDIIRKERQEKSHYTGKLTQIPLENNFFDIKTLGCCMCINRELINLYLKVNFPEGGHDSQCGRLALLNDSLWHFDQPVINYRIHGSNTSGISGIASFGQSSFEQRLQDIQSTILWFHRLLEVLPFDETKKRLLQCCSDFQVKRLGYFNGKTSILYLLKNFKFYRNFSMFCGDIAYKYGINKSIGLLRWKLGKI